MSSIYTIGNDKYFYSNKIKVFPCAYRSVTYDATARLNTEYNFTHLPHTVDKKSYIIKFNDISENEPKAELICVIQGYYFEIELDGGDFTTLQNKYLNICVASPKSPEGTAFIEGPHLCSWDSSDSVEATLDGKPEGSDYYIFKGLKIGEGALSNGSYQCYALKLDASAKLPIMANKIEDSAEDNAGVPISSKFTTGTLSATTSISTPELKVASDKLIAKSDGITASTPVTINSTLDVKTGNTSVLKAENNQVIINKPTNITGTTTIKGDTQIKKSSSGATDGNLKVAGIGNFGNKLTVTSGGASITGTTELIGTVGITGKATIGSGDTKTEIENDTIKTSEILADKIAVVSDKLIVDSGKVTTNIPVTINNTLDVKTETGETSVLKVDREKVTINKPTEIKGTNGNLIVAGTGSFGGKLTTDNEPQESKDVVRLGDLDILTLWNVSILTQEQVNLLF